MSKVYVNPNYKSKKNIIHTNPYVQVKPSIYINPKLMKNIAYNHNQEQETTKIVPNIQNKISVHVNPKLMTKLISRIPEKNEHISNLLSIQNSSFISTVPIIQNKSNCLPSTINGTSISSVPSSVKIKSTMVVTPVSEIKSANYIIKSKTKFINNGNSFIKNTNSNLIALSRRKLVRIKKSPKLTNASINASKLLTMSKKKLLSSRLRKIKSNQKNLLCTISQLKTGNNIKLIKNVDKYKINWYNKFDKTVLKSCRKKIIPSKNIINNSLGLVSIGGIMYKTSRNQLIRSNSSISSLKRRCIVISNKHSQYYITKNGKKLLKIDSTKKKMNNSLVKINTPISSIKNYKANASNKVKQRSLQILRNKMRKNNQPCLLFQRFGYCANKLAGSCPKVHDKKQVALCKNFLQGKCLLDNCRLSHNVGPEKMPTCKYFLEGCCIRERCPFLHVKLSSRNPICIDFLRGYCSQGNMCQKRHIHVCPEFDRIGKCSKGKFCQYPHQSHLTETKRFVIAMHRKINETNTKQLEKISTKPQITECRKRYYNETSKDLSQKREKLLKRVKIKDMQAEQYVIKNEIKNDKYFMNCEQTLEKYSRPRNPIGPLPSYIPIN